MKLGLGTVQFGSHYGISNKAGAPSTQEIENIIDAAYQGGIQIIDTAPAYNCEKLLGESFAGKYEFKIVTKTPVFGSNFISNNDIKDLEICLLESLSRLKKDKLYALLVHHCDDLFKSGGSHVYKKMCEYKDAGLVEKLGVSIYTPDQVERVLSRFPIDVIQIPLNVLDQRLIAKGYLSTLKNKGIEIHARSVFLQGLLLMDPNKLHPYFEPVREHLHSYHQFLKELGLTPVEAALNFVLNVNEVDHVLVGVNNNNELIELIKAVDSNSFIPISSYTDYACFEDTIIDPSKWVVT